MTHGTESEPELKYQNLRDDSALEVWEQQMRRSGVAEEEISSKVSTLLRFCEFVGATPTELVSRCLSNGGVVIKERKKIERLIEEFAGGSVTEANAIRSFMIHNGIRMIAPKPPWL